MKSKKDYSWAVFPAVLLLVVIGLVIFVMNSGSQEDLIENDFIINNAEPSVTSIDISKVEISSEVEIKTTSDGTKYIVDQNLIKGGGPAKDGIPSIDNPRYVSVNEADGWIEDDALVLAIVYEGVERAYPLQVMTWHEIVNDWIAGDPILITYCPLCGSGIAYERTLAGEPVEFGTSGKLYNSNLVMYDRATDTYWTQIDGKAIVGELTGAELNEISLDTVTWKQWKSARPNSEVLSQNTGFSRNYGRDPYANYFADDFLFFQTPQNVDSTGRISNKEFVYGIEVSGKYKAYRKVDVENAENGVLEDEFRGVSVKLELQEDGRIIITNSDSGEEIVKEVDFWFAWYAFHPDSELYGFD